MKAPAGLSRRLAPRPPGPRRRALRPLAPRRRALRPLAPRRLAWRRGAQLVGGVALYAASMALVVHAAQGSMPWDVLTQGLAHRTGLSFGTVTLLTSLVVLACWWPLRQRPGIGTVVNVVGIGLLVDPALAALDRLPSPLPVPAAVGLAVLGIALNGVATGLYVGARLGPGPRDGLMTGLVARTGRSVRLVRTSLEVTVVAAGWVLGGTVGWATLVYALAVGALTQLFLRLFSVPAPHTAADSAAEAAATAPVPAATDPVPAPC